VQPLKRRAGLDAELSVQQVAGPAEDLQRLDLTAGPVQREHQMSAQTLSVRMLPGEIGQPGGHFGVPSQVELGLRQPFLSGEPGLLQSPSLLGDERAIAEIRERRSSPQVQRRAQPVTGGFEISTVQGRAALRGEAAETCRIESVGNDRIPARPPRQDMGAEQPPQLMDVELDVAPSGRGRLITPDGSDQPVDRHRLAGPRQQRGERELKFRCSADRDRPTVAGHAERPKNMKLHADSAPSDLPREECWSIAHFVNRRSERERARPRQLDRSP
jgi:hypothetical protein